MYIRSQYNRRKGVSIASIIVSVADGNGYETTAVSQKALSRNTISDLTTVVLIPVNMTQTCNEKLEPTSNVQSSRNSRSHYLTVARR